MKHLILCREYPPAPSGGIGVYARLFSRLLAERGETVHVIGQLWEKSTDRIERECEGRLIIHRVPYENGASLFPRKPHPALDRHMDRSLFASEFPQQCFAWRAALLAERLVKDENIDLIEAQEYEAPLYYFQLRRALGLGPARRPPCVVHLHSPTEFIARHNDWDQSLPGLMTARRLEEYSLAAADAVLSPSRYLAREAETHFGLAAGAVTVIPYALGDSQIVSRRAEIWSRGSICYSGRLEPRKGVLEWIDAAIRAAPDFPTARFVFIGADTLDKGNSVRATMERRIPGALRSAFRFYGERPRETLPRLFAEARLAVVPSRWENFPFSCMEAMGSGLPVIASSAGGMAEMIDDGESGWLAESTQPDQLAEALRRALATHPDKLAEMGARAAVQVRHYCGNDKVVEARVAFHDQVMQQGAARSLRLPANLSKGTTCIDDLHRLRDTQVDSHSGIAVVVTCSGPGQSPDDCLRNLAGQTQTPITVVVAFHGAGRHRNDQPMDGGWPSGVQVLREHYADDSSARNAAIEAIISAKSIPRGIAFLSADDRLKPTFVAVCESVLKTCPEVGLVSCWSANEKARTGAWIKPCPGFPYQWLSNDAVPFSAVRTVALCEAGRFRVVMKPGYDHWDLWNAVLAQGWIAVTVPEVLVQSPFGAKECPYLANGDPDMRAELLGRFPDLIARDAREIALYDRSGAARQSRPGMSAWGERLSRARVMLLYPRSTVRQIYGRLRNKVLRYAERWVSPSSREVT